MNQRVDSNFRVQDAGTDFKVEKRSKKRSIPVKVPVQSEADMGKKHRAVKSHNKKVEETAASHINVKIPLRPIDLWETYPTINLVEIRHVREIKQLKRDLALHLSKTKGHELRYTEYDLSPFGLSKKVQIIGNVYIPIKRSEHLDIQSTLIKASPELGIKNSQAITFIIIEDEIFDEVIPALHLHSGVILDLPEEEAKKEEKAADMARFLGVSKSRHFVAEGSRASLLPRARKEQVVRLLLDFIAYDFYKRDKADKKKDRELLKEEKCIKFALLQYERLQKLVLTESKKRDLTSHDFESIVQKWEDSCPPFPIRTAKSSTLWRELKSKMVEGFKI